MYFDLLVIKEMNRTLTILSLSLSLSVRPSVCFSKTLARVRTHEADKTLRLLITSVGKRSGADIDYCAFTFPVGYLGLVITHVYLE